GCIVGGGLVAIALLVDPLGDVGRAQAQDRLDFAEQVLDYVMPVWEHVDDDAAAVFLPVVPRRPLRRLPVAFEHPVAEVDAHRKDPSEETAFDETAQLHKARQPQLILDYAVLDSRRVRFL